MTEETTPEEETKNWVRRVISSCNNSIHFDYAQVIVDLYKEKTSEEEGVEMQQFFNEQYNLVHHIIK